MSKIFTPTDSLKIPIDSWKETLESKRQAGSGDVRRFNDQNCYILKRADFPTPGKTVAHFIGIDESINVVAVELTVTQTPAGPATTIQVLPLDLKEAGLTEATLQSLVRQVISDEAEVKR